MLVCDEGERSVDLDCIICCEGKGWEEVRECACKEGECSEVLESFFSSMSHIFRSKNTACSVVNIFDPRDRYLHLSVAVTLKKADNTHLIP